jgi:hypothetical protein
MSHHDTVQTVLNILDDCSPFTFRGEDKDEDEGITILQDTGNNLGPVSKCDTTEDSHIHLLQWSLCD